MKIARIERLKDMEAGHGAERWLVGFTDLTTLLLAFFIMLFSATNVKNAAWVEASTSMRSSFSGDARISQVTGQSGQAESSHAPVSVERDPGLNVYYLSSLIKKRLAGETVLRDLQTEIYPDSVLISLPSDLAFEPGDDMLSGKGEAVLNELAAFLGKLPNMIEVVGHADPGLVDEGGQFGSNWHLSLARAYTVAHVLEEKGVSQPMAIRGRGTGDWNKITGKRSKAEKNERARRVDIRLYTVAP